MKPLADNKARRVATMLMVPVICAMAFMQLPTVASGAQAKAASPTRIKPKVGIDTRFGDLATGAQIAMHRQDFATGIAKATAALEMRPDDKNAAVLYALRGHGYFSTNEYRRAIADCDEALRRDPNVMGAYGNRGAAYVELGEHRKGIEDLTIALQRDPKFPSDLYYRRALAYSRVRAPERARADWLQITKLPARDGLERATRACAYHSLRNYKAAAADYAAAKRASGSVPWILNAAAWFEATCPDAAFRNGKAAVRDAIRLCEITKWQKPGYIDTLAVAYAETGDFVQAVHYAQQALKTATPRIRDDVEKHLRSFEKQKPWREEGEL
jgi:tetratricopeptide (TPR) repeat protein